MVFFVIEETDNMQLTEEFKQLLESSTKAKGVHEITYYIGLNLPDVRVFGGWFDKDIVLVGWGTGCKIILDYLNFQYCARLSSAHFINADEIKSSSEQCYGSKFKFYYNENNKSINLEQIYAACLSYDGVIVNSCEHLLEYQSGKEFVPLIASEIVDAIEYASGYQ